MEYVAVGPDAEPRVARHRCHRGGSHVGSRQGGWRPLLAAYGSGPPCGGVAVRSDPSPHAGRLANNSMGIRRQAK